MFATETTRRFKTGVIGFLKASGLGYDTRYRYYREYFPDMAPDELARLICDPIEFYDPDWSGYLASHGAGRREEEVLAEFVQQRDSHFQQQARIAVMCFDEAGFGTGANAMRFITARKPVIGFYHPQTLEQGANLISVLQLGVEYPQYISLRRYTTLDDITEQLAAWLKAL